MSWKPESNRSHQFSADAIGLSVLFATTILIIFAVLFLFSKESRSAESAPLIIILPTKSTIITQNALPTALPTKTPIPTQPVVLPLPVQDQNYDALPPPTPEPVAIATVENSGTVIASSPEITLPLLPSPQADTIPQKVPILMYHYLSDPPADADIYRHDLSVSPQAFREQLTYLRDNGFVTIDFDDLSQAMRGNQPLPPRRVLLTFDDGHRDHYTNAFPLLKEFGMKATFFIITDLAETWNDNHLTWPMIEEMSQAGLRMEIHTKSHFNLGGKSRKFIWDEIEGSQKLLTQHIGYQPRYLAYPGGSYDEQVLGIVRELDLSAAVTTRWGWDHSYEKRYTMPRLRIRNTTSIKVFSDIVNLQIR